MPDFSLETGDGTRLADPSATQIRETLMGLHGADNPFAILDDPEGRFVQAYGSHIDGFALEYCPARGASVRQVDPSPVPLDIAMRVFEALRAGEMEPLGDLAWNVAYPVPQADPDVRAPRRWASLWLAGIATVLLVLSVKTGSTALQDTALALLSVFCLGSVADGIGSGTIRGRFRWYSRDESPVLFWFMIGLYSFFGVAIALALVL